MKEVNGHKHEPYEHLVVEVPSEHQNTVMQLVLEQQGDFQRMESHRSSTQVEFHIPTRSLIGLRTRMLTGHAGHRDHSPQLPRLPAAEGQPAAGRPTSVFISKDTGKVTAYSAEDLSGNLFVGPQDAVYEGQIVGDHNRDNDMVVNVTRPKPLTNMRASGSDKAAVLKPPREYSMEMALEYIEDDELVEITPAAIRMRKLFLKEGDRKRQGRHSS